MQHPFTASKFPHLIPQTILERVYKKVNSLEGAEGPGFKVLSCNATQSNKKL